MTRSSPSSSLTAALTFGLTLALTLIGTGVAWAGDSQAESFWPQWRGPLGTGVAADGNPPVHWSEDQNVRWKIAVPGKGLSSPVIWGDHLFLLTAVATVEEAAKPAEESSGSERSWPPTVTSESPHRFVVLALDRHTGKTIWERTAREEVPHEGYHSDASWASASPVTDGKHVWAFFGSRGLYCYDMSGKLIWQQDLGDMTTRNAFGEGSSPAISGNTIVVNWDHEGPSFIVALDKLTGKQLWKAERDERTTWATPLIVEREGNTQVVTSGTNNVRSYDLATGKLLWQSKGLTVNVIPSPVLQGDMVYVTSGFSGAALHALDLSSFDEETGSPRIAWQLNKSTPYVPSPLLYDDTFYFLKVNNGDLSCVDTATGQVHYQSTDLEGISKIYASPVGAAGRVYMVGRQGTTLVLRRGATFEVLARNKLDDGFDASPAIVGQDLYLRGLRSLYCLREQAAPTAKTGSGAEG
jgi:outer membrane protein assembly factor BamB